jgi:hypothetical protein
MDVETSRGHNLSIFLPLLLLLQQQQQNEENTRVAGTYLSRGARKNKNYIYKMTPSNILLDSLVLLKRKNA